jgi:hypothetical protein
MDHHEQVSHAVTDRFAHEFGRHEFCDFDGLVDEPPGELPARSLLVPGVAPRATDRAARGRFQSLASPFGAPLPLAVPTRDRPELGYSSEPVGGSGALENGNVQHTFEQNIDGSILFVTVLDHHKITAIPIHELLTDVDADPWRRTRRSSCGRARGARTPATSA